MRVMVVVEDGEGLPRHWNWMVVHWHCQFASKPQPLLVFHWVSLSFSIVSLYKVLLASCQCNNNKSILFYYTSQSSKKRRD